MVDANPQTFAFDRIDRRTQKVTPALITAITERIVATIKPRQIVLFGSQVTKENHNQSDIDLLICLDDHHPLAFKRRHERTAVILDLFRYRSFGLDIIVLTQGEVQGLIDANEGEWDLVIEILKKGKLLYEYSAPVDA